MDLDIPWRSYAFCYLPLAHGSEGAEESHGAQMADTLPVAAAPPHPCLPFVPLEEDIW